MESNLISRIGENAGIVWRALNAAGEKVTMTKLKEATGLKAEELAMAIGWLARECNIVIAEEGKKTVYGLM